MSSQAEQGFRIPLQRELGPGPPTCKKNNCYVSINDMGADVLFCTVFDPIHFTRSFSFFQQLAQHLGLEKDQ